MRETPKKKSEDDGIDLTPRRQDAKRGRQFFIRLCVFASLRETPKKSEDEGIGLTPRRQAGKYVDVIDLDQKPHSAKLSIEQYQIDELRIKHGEALRAWWEHHFGFDYDCLTSSEGGYLLRTPYSERIRNRIIAAFQKGSQRPDPEVEEH